MTEENSLATKVLVVDDNDMTRTMLRGILRQAGIDVVGEAADGKNVLDIIKRLLPRWRPNLICLDVMMPGESGIEVLKKIKINYPQTKVLMITGSSERNVVQAALSNGANGYLVKPFNATNVLAAVKKALQTENRANN